MTPSPSQPAGAARALAAAAFRHVASYARRFCIASSTLRPHADDMVGEAMVVLMRAARGWREGGMPFINYALMCVRRLLIDCIASIQAQARGMREFASAKEGRAWRSSPPRLAERLAECLDVPPPLAKTLLLAVLREKAEPKDRPALEALASGGEYKDADMTKVQYTRACRRIGDLGRRILGLPPRPAKPKAPRKRPGSDFKASQAQPGRP